MKILLVDDSGTMRTIQKRMLQGLGLTDIIEAADGFQAVRMAVEQKPLLIFMDWNMPNMNGIEALKKLKASSLTYTIPVIMVTSESEKGHILEAVKAGAANYVVKPFTLDVIREKLAPFFKQHGFKEPVKGEPAPAAAAEAAAPADAGAAANSAEATPPADAAQTDAKAVDPKPAETKT